MSKFVYFFGKDVTDGKSSMKDLLGGKCAGLAEMANLGIPVPPGFELTPEVCKLFLKNKNQKEMLSQMEKITDTLGLLNGEKIEYLEDFFRLSIIGRGIGKSSIFDLERGYIIGPNDKQVWSYLHDGSTTDLHDRSTTDQNNYLKLIAASVLGSAFPYIPDKQQAWNDLNKLATDQNKNIRWMAISSLDSAFPHIPEKQQAWNDLINLIADQNKDIMLTVVSVLGFAFRYVPDKRQAWNDLINLTSDQNVIVKRIVVSTLDSIYSQTPDEQQVWNDLIKLTKDNDSFVRSHTNHSLGKISISKASKAENEDDYRNKLERAIAFFEKAAQESYSDSHNPSQFCLPFYLSFHTIVFKKQNAEKEVDKYLRKAKEAIEGSKSKKLLFEAVSNLASALKEVQNLENMDLLDTQIELNFYRKYCDHAAELMKGAEEAAPFATAAMRKGLPILDKNLKELLEEIQKKTERIREQTKGTQLEELGDELSISGQSLLQVRDPVGFKKQVNYMQHTLKAICSKLPEGQKGEACELLKLMYAESSIEDKIPLMVNILSKFSYHLDMTAHLNRIEEKLDHKFNNIRFDVFEIKLNSYNIISNLYAIKKELEKLNEMGDLNVLSINKLNSNQAEKLNDLNNSMKERLDEIKFLIDDLPNNDDIQKINDSLNQLKQSEADILLQRFSAILSLISFIIPVLQQSLTHKLI